MNADSVPMYEWNTIPWRKLEKNVFKLQKRIYQASSRGNVKNVHKLQRLLIKSWSAKCLAVRKVTQDNQGKKTAGVDGVKSLFPKARMSLVKRLKLGNKAMPTRRIWIPKPSTKEKRPLGIPTIYDRALQALVKLALEPEWEARFEPNSYGFRPGRSVHDAIEAIFLAIRLKPKYVFDADIAKCFERINHKALLKKINSNPLITRQIKAWLKAGVNEETGFDFLGFTIRQHKVSKYNSGKRMSGYKTLITPSKEAIQRHASKIREVLRSLKAAPQKAVISQLNPIIKGWANFYSSVVSRKAFECLDNLIHWKLWRWAKFRHPHKEDKWVRRKYFRQHGNDQWVFKEEEGSFLYKHRNVGIIRHTKVQGERSPYDGNWVYWSSRMSKHPSSPKRIGALLKKQRGKCTGCKLYFKLDDLMEVHHLDRNRKNNKEENLELLHRHCHDKIHGSMNDNHQLAEERCEEKFSRTVLKTSTLSDGCTEFI